MERLMEELLVHGERLEWWKRRDDNQTRIALKFKRFSRSSIDILARSISPFFFFFYALLTLYRLFLLHHSYGPFSRSSFSVSHSLGLTRSPIVSLVVNRLRKCLTVRRRGRENVKRKDIPCYFTYRVRFLCINRDVTSREIGGARHYFGK